MRINGLRAETKAVLDLLIRQIQDALSNAGPTGTEQNNAVKGVLDEWIEGNELHPEHVKHFKTMLELQDWIHKK